MCTKEMRKITTDVVIVGSGMAGLAAAVEASEKDVNVIVLESQKILGGNSKMAEGILGVGTKLQKERGIEVDTVSMLRREMEFQNYNVNPKLWEIVINNSADNVHWLMDHGVSFLKVDAPGGGPVKTWHVYNGPEGFLGLAANRKLAEAAGNAGTVIMTETEGKKLKVKKGKVVGILAEKKNGEWLDISAKAVILACGGMSANPEYIKTWTNRNADNMHYFGSPGNNGSGIRMAAEAGAGEPKNVMICMVGLSVPNTNIRSQLSTSGAMEEGNLWLNQDGLRFVNESIVTQYTRAGNIVQSQEKVISLYDQDRFDSLVKEGCTNGFGMFVLPGDPCTDLQEELKRYAKNKDIVVSDNLSEIAAAFGLDPETVEKSVAEYNALCKAGEDTQYGKEAKHLHPIARPPFYAFHIVSNNLNSMGGIRIDTHCHVLNEHYEIIPGLFCAGMDCSGFAGETYGIAIPGSDQGIALCTGRIAGAEAAASVNTV